MALALASCAATPPPPAPLPAPDARVASYERYLAAWSAVPIDERLHFLHESVTPDVVFTNPTRTRTGIEDVAEHLSDFQRRVPGGSFRVVSMLGWEDHALVRWQLVDARGNAGLAGHDDVAYDQAHRIKSIVMFTDIPKERLK